MIKERYQLEYIFIIKYVLKNINWIKYIKKYYLIKIYMY